MVLLLALSALAADPAVYRALDLASTDRVEEAIRLVVDGLEADPDAIAWHRAYVWMLTEHLREGDTAIALYRLWHAREPDAPAARVGLAQALHAEHFEQGSWCEEVETLIEPLPEDAEAAYWLRRARYEARRICPGDREEDRRVLLDLAGPVEAARGHALRLRLHRGEAVEGELAEALLAWLQGDLLGLPEVVGLWRKEASGEALDAVRERAVARAQDAVASDDPVAVAAALRILRAAGEEADEAEARLAALDPERGRVEHRSNRRTSWSVPAPDADERDLERAIFRAQRLTGPRKAIHSLEELESRMPDTGPLRASWLRYLAENREWAHQRKKGFADRLAAWEADPTDRSRALELGRAALQADDELRKALHAVETALVAPPAWEARGMHWADGYTDWREDEARVQALLLDVRGELLVRMGRRADGVASLRQALLVGARPPAEPFLHLGLQVAERGRSEEALHYLGLGLAHPRPADQEELVRGARRVARSLFLELRWADGDFEDWLATRWPAPEAEEAAGSYRIGQILDDVVLHPKGGEPTRLSAYPGLRVVDVWATWCGPCVASLPSLDALARKHHGELTVLVVSVDAEQTTFERYRRFGSHVTPVWAGQAGSEAWKSPTLPTTFLVDGEGRVLHHQTGWSSADTRLEDAVEAALGD